MSRLLWRITAHLAYRQINDGTRPYLERYYVGTLLGWRFYLHRFVGSDPDRGLHCHPWRIAFSIILSGWYWEETRMGTHKVRWFNWLTGDSFHRVVLPCSADGRHPDAICSLTHGVSPCWTLFFHRVGNVKPWGFLQKFDDHAGEDDHARVFVPYTYSREGRQDNWWLTAPKRGEA